MPPAGSDAWRRSASSDPLVGGLRLEEDTMGRLKWTTLGILVVTLTAGAGAVSATNQNGCFNWFEPGDTRRGSGEAASIRKMIDSMIARRGVDRGVQCSAPPALDLRVGVVHQVTAQLHRSPVDRRMAPHVL